MIHQSATGVNDLFVLIYTKHFHPLIQTFVSESFYRKKKSLIFRDEADNMKLKMKQESRIVRCREPEELSVGEAVEKTDYPKYFRNHVVIRAQSRTMYLPS
jgi:hypothetical protein